jgi:hypothetical protein
MSIFDSISSEFGGALQSAPQQSVAAGLSKAFNSSDTPPFSQMVSSLFGQSNGTQQAGILNMLLASAGPAVASSALGSLLGQVKSGTPVTPDQASQLPPAAVQELAEHAQKHDPSIIDQASNFYAQHPKVVQALGAGALALIMSHISQEKH